MERIRRSYNLAVCPDSVTRYATSWILPPWALFFWRALVSLYAFAVIFTILGHQGAHDDSRASRASFSYFTVLGYWGLAFYYAFAAAHTASYWRRGEAWLHDWPKPLRWLHGVYYATVTTFPFLVTAVFWAVLSAGALTSQFTIWSNISEHALNTVFAFAEVVLPRTNPHPWINLVPVVVLLALYLALAYITHATEGFYVYGFLDPKESPANANVVLRRTTNGHGVVAGACVGILAATVLLFTVVRYAILLRKWATESKLGMTGKFSSRRPRGGAGEIMEIDHVPFQSVQTKTAGS
ncbi:hypothetical protein MBLNU459_g5161t3 [Dothideomycetes sp. NU459]